MKQIPFKLLRPHTAIERGKDKSPVYQRSLETIITSIQRVVEEKQRLEKMFISQRFIK